jgi:hypothetical protein
VKWPLEKRKKSMYGLIMNNKNIMNYVSIFNDSVAMNKIGITVIHVNSVGSITPPICPSINLNV